MLYPRKFFLVRWMYAVHPNWYTAARMAGVVPLLFLITRGNVYGAFVLFLVLAITDILDGHVARVTGKVTPFGKFFDPMADKIFLLTALFMLLPSGTLVAFLVLLALEVALFVTAFFAYAAPDSFGSALGANPFGKIKAFIEVVIEMMLFCALLIGIGLNSEALSELLGFAIGFAILSLVGHWVSVLRPKIWQIPSIR